MKANKVLVAGAVLMTAVFLSVPSNLLATDASKTAGSVTDVVSQAAASMEKLNINTASIESLAKIPGIGDKVSEGIAAYREAHGAFKSISDLVNVEGIDASLLEKIKPFLSI
jgi:competence protein ComEA